MDEQSPLRNWKLHPIGPVFKFEVCTMHFNVKGFKIITVHSNFQTFLQHNAKENLILVVLY